MSSLYELDAGAESYLEFLESYDGKIFQQTIALALIKRLEGTKGLSILDAGCGPGWLSNLLAAKGHRVQACDISPQMIKKARADFPDLDFQICDLTKSLPYPNKQFDCAILALSALDLSDQQATYTEIKRVLKAAGRLIIITVNPYYGYPVGVWKRGVLGRLLRKNPELKLRSYFDFVRKTDRSFLWNKNKLASFFYTLPEQINLLTSLDFTLRYLADVESPVDDKVYSLKYRLYRFPVFILLEFQNP